MVRSERLLGVRQRPRPDLLILAAGVVFWGFMSLGATCGAPPPKTLPDGSDACTAMCANERTINATDSCPGYTGAPSPGGTSCEDACHAQDPTFNLHSVCVAEANNCTQMKACFNGQ